MENKFPISFLLALGAADSYSVGFKQSMLS